MDSGRAAVWSERHKIDRANPQRIFAVIAADHTASARAEFLDFGRGETNKWALLNRRDFERSVDVRDRRIIARTHDRGVALGVLDCECYFIIKHNQVISSESKPWLASLACWYPGRASRWSLGTKPRKFISFDDGLELRLLALAGTLQKQTANSASPGPLVNVAR